MPHHIFTKFFHLILFVAINTSAYAMGNHPESNLCPADKPYFVFCSHSLHNLEGWFGGCYATQDKAEQSATTHAKKEHSGNTRWTGVKQNQKPNY